MVCEALGVITETEIRQRLGKGGLLDRMFKARNEIVHQLDLARDGSRTERPLGEAMDYATEALTVTQLMINQVGKILPPKEPLEELTLE